MLNPAVTRARRHVSAPAKTSLAAAKSPTNVNVTSQKKRRESAAQVCPNLPFSSPCTIFTKAEDVTMGTHYQATSVAWHDAQ